MAGHVLLVLLSVAALLTDALGAHLAVHKKAKNAEPDCSGPSLPFSNPDDCSTYYQCTGTGTWDVLHCPPGLEFSATDNVCEYPEQAKCSTSSSAGEDTPSDDEGHESEDKPSGSDLPECPYPADPNVVVHHPNPDDCSSFYKCGLDGVPVLIPCPQGLEYNAAAEACDYPENAGCSTSSGGADKPEEGTGDDGQNEGSGNEKPPSDSPLPECPFPADPSVVVHFPNPVDCGSFYKCGLDGVPVLINCQAGLEYNPEAEACDYPENVGCSMSSGGSLSDNKPTGNSDSSKPAGPANPGSPSGSSSLPDCPFPADPEAVVQFPNPEDCGSFYKCGLDGVPVLIDCPEDLEYNAEAQVCDYPASAGCSVSRGNGNTEHHKEDIPSNCKPAAASLPECPIPADPENVVQFPNPDDCSTFYKCGLDGVPVLIKCPDGLEYNAEAQVCDYPASAGCSVGKHAAASLPECPVPADPENVVQFPNPDDCSTFYKCGLDGVPVLVNCPEGLEYNADLQVCDYPASAGCSISHKYRKH